MGVIKANYRYLRSVHRCVQCGTVDAYTLNGRAYCADCAEWRRNYYNNRRKRPDVREKANQQLRDRTEKWRSQGLCTSCGRKTDPPYKTCSRCRYMARAKYRESHPYPVMENGVCSWCRKRPPIDGKKLCDECYRKSLLNVSKAAETKRGRKRAKD